MKISCLGPLGTNCFIAAKEYAKENDEIILCCSIRDAISSVILKAADICVVPLENSIEGSVSETITTILQNNKLNICGEIILCIDHILVSKNNIKLNKIKKLYSHPQAIAQCRNFIEKHMSYAEIIECSSTAEAALIASNEKFSSAISNMETLKEYKLIALRENIQDVKNNQTKFVCLSTNKRKNGWGQKITLVFSTLNKPGELYKILGLFNIFDINLTKIESRAARTVMGEYIFWIDFETMDNKSNVDILLKQIEKKSTYFRIIGSYNIFA